MIKSHYSSLITCERTALNRSHSTHGLPLSPPSSPFHLLTHSRERGEHKSSTLNCGRLATQRLMSNKCNLFMASSLPLPPLPPLPPSLSLKLSPQNASSFQHNYHKHTHTHMFVRASATALVLCKSLATLSIARALSPSLTRSFSLFLWQCAKC